MRIATFNANSIRTRLPIILQWLKDNEPDILCIQETKVQDHAFPEAVFTDKGWHVTFRGEKSYNGVAMISRQAPDKILFGINDGEQPDETRFCYAKYGPLHVVNTYVPQGREIDHPMYAYKIAWFKRLKQWFSKHVSPEDLVVWVGDLNVAPEAMDIHNAERQTNHVCFHETVRNTFQDTLQWGFADVFRKFHPEPGQYTFFDYRTPNAAKRAMGWRIDHILATKPLYERAADAFIDLQPRLVEKPSDHTFLCADFDIDNATM